MGVKNKKDYDFAGWVTKNDVRCSDGRMIRQNAFAHMDGKRVSLVYNHDHGNIDNVLGYVDLENRPQGVYGYAKTADTDMGKTANTLVHSGSLVAFSIYANNLKEEQHGDVLDVIHGDIKEVSLVLAGANEEALIDEYFEHGADGETEMYFYNASGEKSDSLIDFFAHSKKDDEEDEKEEETEEPEDEKADSDDSEQEEEDEDMEDTKKKDLKHSDDASSEKKVEDIVNTMTDEQKDAMYALIGAAMADAKSGSSEEDEKENEEEIKHSDEGGEVMKTNLFENDVQEQENVLAHSDMNAILESAKTGSRTLKQTFNDYCLAHSIDTTGMNILPTSTPVPVLDGGYGVRDLDMLFPEYKYAGRTPEWIKRDTTWVDVVMAGVKKVPYKRLKSMFADITEDEARAKGYIKGDQKFAEVFELLGRTTDPQTIYKLQKLDRDDILDIEDFDVVAWIKGEMQIMLNEEKARAILIGDGRTANNRFKIKEDHVRSIVNDVPLFNIKVNVNVPANATEDVIYKEFRKAILRARKQYKGSGNPTLFTTEDVLTELLLLEDGIGHPLYDTVEKLATALRVSRIVTVQVMEGQQVDNKPLMGVIVNLNDYTIGGDGNREKGMFEDFDIDFNKYTYLIETRMSGALMKPYSAMTIMLNQAQG